MKLLGGFVWGPSTYDLDEFICGGLVIFLDNGLEGTDFFRGFVA